MGVLRKLFGPSQAEVWRQLCSEIGAEFIEGGFWRGNKAWAQGAFLAGRSAFKKTSGN